MKKRSLIIFMIMLIPMLFMQVEAKKVTVNEFVTEFNRLAKDYGGNEFVSNVEATIDSDNKKVKVTADTENILLTYTDDYLEYTRSGGAPTDLNLSGTILDSLIFNALLETMFSLAGVSSDYSVSLPSDYNNDFDKYNVVFEFKDYTYNITQDDGSSQTGESSYIDNYKIGFDTEKITEYAKIYGSETDSKKYGGLVPKLSLKISSEGKPMYLLDLDYTPKNDDDTPYCKVYRAESIDDDYINIIGNSSNSNWSMGCIETVEGMLHGDTTAEANKVYYYKAQVIGSDKYSDIFKVDLANNTVENVTTGEKINSDAISEDKDNTSDKEENSDTKTDDTDKKLENPNTGDFLPFLPILLLMMISIIIWHKVGNKFAKI